MVNLMVLPLTGDSADVKVAAKSTLPPKIPQTSFASISVTDKGFGVVVVVVAVVVGVVVRVVVGPGLVVVVVVVVGVGPTVDVGNGADDADSDRSFVTGSFCVVPYTKVGKIQSVERSIDDTTAIEIHLNTFLFFLVSIPMCTHHQVRRILLQTKFFCFRSNFPGSFL
jgi:hypothetical protein